MSRTACLLAAAWAFVSPVIAYSLGFYEGLYLSAYWNVPPLDKAYLSAGHLVVGLGSVAAGVYLLTARRQDM